MSITISNVIDEINRKRRDGSSLEIDQGDQFAAIQEILEYVKSIHIFPWDIRTQFVKYYDTLTRYSAPSDFFKFILPKPENRNSDLVEISPDRFDREEKFGESNIFAMEHTDKGMSLRLKSFVNLEATDVSLLASYDGNGTWEANTGSDATGSDATGVDTDVNLSRYNSSSVRFDIDVSQSTNNYAEISVDDMSAIDLSDIDKNSAHLIEVYIPDATYISSVILRWGSSSGAYFTKTETTQADGRAIQSGWNTFKLEWDDASQVSSPDNEAINYGLFRIAYSASQGDMKGIRINYWRCAPAEVIPVDYATSAIAKDSDGAYKTVIDDLNYLLLCSGSYDGFGSVIKRGATAIVNDYEKSLDDMTKNDTKFLQMLSKYMENFPDRSSVQSQDINLFV